MRDVTASDFRYAAQTYMADANLRALLLAAAEQREQLEALKADILYMVREVGNTMPPEEALAKLRAARIESEEA